MRRKTVLVLFAALAAAACSNDGSEPKGGGGTDTDGAGDGDADADDDSDKLEAQAEREHEENVKAAGEKRRIAIDNARLEIQGEKDRAKRLRLDPPTQEQINAIWRRYGVSPQED